MQTLYGYGLWLGALLARQSCYSSRSHHGKVSVCFLNVHPTTSLHKDNSKTRKKHYKADTVHTCSVWKVCLAVISFLKCSLSWSHSVLWFVLFFQEGQWNCNKMPFLLQKIFVVSDAQGRFFLSFWWKAPNWWHQLLAVNLLSRNIPSEFQQGKPNFKNQNTVLSRDETVSSWLSSSRLLVLA